MRGCFALLFLAPLAQFVLYCAAGAPIAAPRMHGDKLPRTCKRQMDFSIVVDESASISKEDWNGRMIPFLENLITTIDLDNSDIRISLTTYSTPTRSIFTFLDKEASNTQLAIKRLHEMRDSKPAFGMTYTGNALSFVRKAVLPYGRKNVPKALLLVTDGLSSDSDLTAQEAAMIRDEGVNVMVVGVGDARIEECRGIVGCDGVMDCPMFKHTNWKEMINIFHGLMKEVCDTLPQDATCRPVWSDWSECNAPCNATGTRTRTLRTLETITKPIMGTNGQLGRTCKDQEMLTPPQSESCVGKCANVSAPGHDMPAPMLTGRLADGSYDESYGTFASCTKHKSGDVPADKDIKCDRRKQNNGNSSGAGASQTPQHKVDSAKSDRQIRPQQPSAPIKPLPRKPTPGKVTHVKDDSSSQVRLRGDMDPTAGEKDNARLAKSPPTTKKPVVVTDSSQKVRRTAVDPNSSPEGGRKTPQSPSKPKVNSGSVNVPAKPGKASKDSVTVPGGSTLDPDYGSHKFKTETKMDPLSVNDINGSSTTSGGKSSDSKPVPMSSGGKKTPQSPSVPKVNSGSVSVPAKPGKASKDSVTVPGGSTLDPDYGSHKFKTETKMDPLSVNDINGSSTTPGGKSSDSKPVPMSSGATRGDMTDSELDSGSVSVPAKPGKASKDSVTVPGGSTLDPDYGSHKFKTETKMDPLSVNDINGSSTTSRVASSDSTPEPMSSGATRGDMTDSELDSRSGMMSTEPASPSEDSVDVTGGSTLDPDYGSHKFKTDTKMDPMSDGSSFPTSDLGREDESDMGEMTGSGTSLEHNTSTGSTPQHPSGYEGLNDADMSDMTPEETDLAAQEEMRRELEEEREEDLRRELEEQHKKEREAEERLKQELSANSNPGSGEPTPTSGSDITSDEEGATTGDVDTSGDEGATTGDVDTSGDEGTTSGGENATTGENSSSDDGDNSLHGFHVLSDSAATEYVPPVKAADNESDEESTEGGSSRSSSNTTKIAGGALLGLLLLGAGGGYAMYKKNKGPGFEADPGDYAGGDESSQPIRDAETYTVTEFDNNIWGEAT
ncbi:thrombospondin-related anonymous protein, putative [Babesia bigemina]|uniref:Thrombospondin-related anonymous protein, putative n=1 Tax=Babesia bigemina TaxID=5866 RepID=A0A061D4Z3_BABBI|nr:thrombospondin-related anonymous protein, putative [Babesia bigemina]CDR95117.1 thrombospondin-related anonymous protein, putative [Babesia bigemina]|eukprot:XP_012767303.1 thrombospondin-related anonymous protein, putative [Babesia bigemina]